MEVGGGRCKAEGEQLEKARSGPHQVGVLREIAGLVVLSDPEGKIRPLHATKANSSRDLYWGETEAERKGRSTLNLTWVPFSGPSSLIPSTQKTSPGYNYSGKFGNCIHTNAGTSLAMTSVCLGGRGLGCDSLFKFWANQLAGLPALPPLGLHWKYKMGLNTIFCRCGFL